MKDNYYYDAISFENLYKALKKSCRGVRWKDSVSGYESRGLQNTIELQDALFNENYKLSPYTIFKIYEPKERIICATRIRDRQVQRALCDNGLYEDLTEHFIRDNVACQVDRGTDDALRRLKIHMRRFWNKNKNQGFVLKCDIRHFFDETPHWYAKKVIDKYITDNHVKNLVFQIIDSFKGDHGIGLGSQISQLIELAVLNDMDHLIKEKLKIKYYIRYADDFVLIHDDINYLRYCKTYIQNYLTEIGLSLNKKTCIYPLKQGVVFLQWHFKYTDTGKILMLINKKKIVHQKRKIRKMLKLEHEGKMIKGTCYASLLSWMGNANKGNTYFQRQKMMNYYKERVKFYEQLS